MKIAIVAESIQPERGGAETSTLQFIRQLVRCGLQVDVFTRSAVAPLAGARIHTITTRKAPRPWRTLHFSRAVDGRLQQRQWDVVHAITPCLRADLYQPRGGTVPETVARNLALHTSPGRHMLKRIGNCLNIKQQLMLRLERRLLHRRPPPTVVAVSDYVARQVQCHYGIRRAAIRTIFNGVDHDPVVAGDRASQRRSIRALYSISDDDVLALSVAHNFRLKGIPSWLRALARLKGSGGRSFKAIIVGKDNALPCWKLVRALNLQDAVMFTGPTRCVRSFYHAADIFVHPTYYDPCSRVVLEAMLHGVPCVTTHDNGAAEIISDGVTGRVIASADDVPALAAAARQVAASSYRHALSASHNQLTERLSMRRHALEMIQLYQSLGR